MTTPVRHQRKADGTGAEWPAKQQGVQIEMPRSQTMARSSFEFSGDPGLEFKGISLTVQLPVADTATR